MWKVYTYTDTQMIWKYIHWPFIMNDSLNAYYSILVAEYAQGAANQFVKWLLSISLFKTLHLTADFCWHPGIQHTTLTEKIVLLQLYLKAVRVTAEIWNNILCFTGVLKPQLQPEVANHCFDTVQTVLNFAAGSFCYKITLICLGSSLSV